MRSQCLQLLTLSQSQEVKTQLHPASDQVLLRILLLNLLARLARPSGPASLGLSCSLDFCPDIGVVLRWSGFILNIERCQQIFPPKKQTSKEIIRIKNPHLALCLFRAASLARQACVLLTWGNR